MVGLIIKEKYLNPFEILVHNFHLTIVVMCENICFIALHKQQFLSDSSCYSVIKYSNEIENQEERAFLTLSFLYWIGQNVFKKNDWILDYFSFSTETQFYFSFFFRWFLFVLFVLFIYYDWIAIQCFHIFVDRKHSQTHSAATKRKKLMTMA